MGLGFGDRGDAFDFNVALSDHEKHVRCRACSQLSPDDVHGLVYTTMSSAMVFIRDQLSARWALRRRARDAEQMQAADSSHTTDSSPQPGESDTASLYRLQDLSLKVRPPDACGAAHCRKNRPL